MWSNTVGCIYYYINNCIISDWSWYILGSKDTTPILVNKMGTDWIRGISDFGHPLYSVRGNQEFTKYQIFKN